MCRNSFGPCAFDFGPNTPVIRNCACGNFSPSMFMNGIVPPSPIHAESLPQIACDAASAARFNQGEVAGAFHPVAPQSGSKVTCALYGGSVSSNCLRTCVA